MSKPMFNLRFRQMISLGREWDSTVIHIATGQPYSEPIDLRRAAGASVFIPAAMTGTYLAVYACADDNESGAYWPVYNKDGTLLAVPVTAGTKALVLPAEVFPMGFIKLAACSNSTGTRVNEAAERTLVVTAKP